MSRKRYAFRHLPDGTPHEYAGAVRDPAALLAWRMSCWTRPDGTPVPPRTAARDSAAARVVYVSPPPGVLVADVGQDQADAAVRAALLAAARGMPA